MDTPIFEKLASSLTVKLICDPVLSIGVQADTRLADYFKNKAEDPSGLEFSDYPLRVINADDELIGMLWYGDCMAVDEEQEDEATAADVMDPIGPSKLVGAETSILDIVGLFATKSYHTYYVLHRNEIIGAVSYADLFKPIGRFAFLALALEIEDQALRLCQSYSIRASCWKSISDSRRRKAIKIFRERYGRSPRRKVRSLGDGPDSPRLIACTNLIDKAIMIWKQKLIASVTRADVLGFFHKLQQLRNKCAHPGEHGTLLPKNDLASFVTSAFKMRDSLDDAMEVHGAYVPTFFDVDLELS